MILTVLPVPRINFLKVLPFQYLQKYRHLHENNKVTLHDAVHRKIVYGYAIKTTA